VTGAQAVGRPDIHAGEVPVAFVTLVPGAAVSPDDLRRWAHAHSPEAAAAPRKVTVLDTLPVTSVGKPYKPTLRAEALREAVADALRGLPDVVGVRAVVTGGAVEAVVGLADGADEAPVKEALDRFAVSWRFEQEIP
jgi:fatty-acyl-CoA synthase